MGYLQCGQFEQRRQEAVVELEPIELSILRGQHCEEERARAPFGRRSSMSSVLKFRVLHAVVWVVAEAVRSRRLSISSSGRLATRRSERSSLNIEL